MRLWGKSRLETLCRVGGVLLLTIWIVLLFRPVTMFVPEGADLPGWWIDPDRYVYSYGYEYAVGGWMFAISTQPAPAWFANPLAAWCVLRMLMGRTPGLVTAVTAAGLAASVWAPRALDHSLFARETDGPIMLLAGAHIWVASCAIPLAVLMLVHGLKLSPQPEQAPGGREAA